MRAPGPGRVIRLSRRTTYTVAVTLAAVAVLLRLTLDPFWGLGLPFITFFPAIMFSGWLGGLWPGIVTTLLSAAAAKYFWIDPARSWTVSNPNAWLALIAFVAVGVAMSVLNESWRRQAAAAESARRQAETATEQLRVALEAGGMGTWEYALREGTIHWSPGLEAIHGYGPGTFAGTFEAFRDEIHPEDRDRVLRAIARAVEDRVDHHVEYRIVRADGTERWVEGRGRLFLDEKGQPDRMVGVCSDITERKQADELFRLAVEAAPAAMLLVDDRGTIAVTNALTEQLLGCTRDEIVGQPVDRFVPPAVKARHAEHRANFFAAAQSRPMGAGRDLHVRRMDGREVPVEVGLSPVKTAKGMFVLAAVTDISDRKAVEAERAQLLVREQAARSDVERASRLKDEFLAVLSHELRTPLNAVLGYAHLLGTGALPADRAAHAIAAIQRNAQAQARLVESLLDLSRIMAGKLELDLERLDVSKLLEAAIDVVRPDAEAKAIAVDVALSPSLPALVADGGRVQQVFWNLLSNAIKFTPRGGRIGIHVARQNGEITIQITDTGRGITSEFLPYVFDRFKQAEPSKGRAPSGLGLGLALVREIVHAHGGTVAAESPGEGLGSIFTVALPVSTATTADSAAPHSPGAAVASLPRLDVLVVDDDGDVRDLLRLLLESRGAAVRTAASTAEALDAIVRRKPDVLLADIGMPDEDGYSLIRKVRAREHDGGARRLPAIAVTAFATPRDRDHAFTEGFDGHVAKPVDPDALARAIARVVGPDEV